MAKHRVLAIFAMFVRSFRPVPLVAVLFVILLLGACGSDDSEDRSFAPEAGDNASLPTDTPLPTETAPPIDRQPGEADADVDVPASKLFDQTGPAAAITSGLQAISIVQIENGNTEVLPLPRGTSTVAQVSPDGSRCLVIDRSEGEIAVRLFDADGSVIAEWTPESNATPEASPVLRAAATQTGDRIAWLPDGTQAALALSGLGVFVADTDLKMREIDTGSSAVTSIAWSPTGQSIAVATWNAETRSAAIETVATGSPDGVATSVFALAEGDGRYVRSLAWGSERVGLVFALRTVNSSFTLPNDLYFLPRFGEPMRLLASAGVAAPAAVVDQVAIAGNGTTVAFTVLVPGEAGLRFHSVWATDALEPAATQADSSGIRRVNDIQWTPQGLMISGIRRTQDDGTAYQIAVVEQLSAEEPREIASDRSAATPLASPQASPVEATPES